MRRALHARRCAVLARWLGRRPEVEAGRGSSTRMDACLTSFKEYNLAVGDRGRKCTVNGIHRRVQRPTHSVRTGHY